jgi:hypothetical protein
MRLAVGMKDLAAKLKEHGRHPDAAVPPAKMHPGLAPTNKPYTVDDALRQIDATHEREDAEAEAKEAAEWEVVKVHKSCIPKGAKLVEAYETAIEVVVMGVPPDDEHLPEDKQHNCDAMGCGFTHVIYRFNKP